MPIENVARVALLWLSGLALGLPAAAHAQAPPSVPAVAAEAAPSRPARQRVSVRPYLEVDQVVSAALNGDGDVLTYTAVAAGVDGRVATRRLTAQASYRYERRFSWNDDLADQDVHSGIAVASAVVVPRLLTIDAGALATRTAGEGRVLGLTDRDPTVSVYSVHAGPTLSTRAGPLSVGASYRFGYVAVDDDTLDGTPAAAPIEDAVAHMANASVGMPPGRLPFGWTLGAGYAREESGDLDHIFEGAYVRGDVVVPVSPTFALTAGIGYETIEASQQDILLGPGGAPVIGPGGRLVPDPDRPRLLALDIDGLIYDGGFIWRPSARTELQARAGHRYGGTTVTASLRHRFNRSWGVSARVYDGVETFGRLLINDINTLPDDFEIEFDPLAGDLALGGCIFGADPGSGACLDRALQSVTAATFRHRGASLVVSGRRGPWDIGLGAGYSWRRTFLPEGSSFAALQPRVDESVVLFGTMGRALSRTSAVDFHLFANWFDSDRPEFDERFGAGFTAAYSQRLLERIQFLAAAGLHHQDGGDFDRTTASALLGLRYNF